MIKFEIFIKSNKFYWSNNKIILLIYAIFIGIILIKKSLFGLEKTPLDGLLTFLFIIFIILSLGIALLSVIKTETLQGKLDGFIIYKKDEIYINDEVFTLEIIKTIHITNDDYYGKFRSTRDFNPNLSNGTRNYLTLKLNSGEIKRFRFRLNLSDDLQKIKPELIHYYKNGKIDFSNLAYILGDNSKKEITELQKEIKNYYLIPLTPSNQSILTPIYRDR